MREATPKILIVDDESSVLCAFQRCLRKHFRIDVAPGAAAALALVRENGPYAVVLSDLRMPEIDGVEFLSIMAEIAPTTTRIALTGTCERTQRDAAFASGRVFAFLSKPCEFDEVLNCLQRGVQHHQEQAVVARKSGSIDSPDAPPVASGQTA